LGQIKVGILKSELIRHHRFKGPHDALRAIFEYIEVDYNRKIRHWTIKHRLNMNRLWNICICCFMIQKCFMRIIC